jgi:hypothetical protein
LTIFISQSYHDIAYRRYIIFTLLTIFFTCWLRYIYWDTEQLSRNIWVISYLKSIYQILTIFISQSYHDISETDHFDILMIFFKFWRYIMFVLGRYFQILTIFINRNYHDIYQPRPPRYIWDISFGYFDNKCWRYLLL